MKVALFGDDWGLKQLLSVIPPEHICAITTAWNRSAAEAVVQQKVIRQNPPMVHLVQPSVKKKKKYDRYVASLREQAPDLIVVSAYSLILRPQILNIPPLGAVNIHGGLLPQYRGANILNWVLVNGERETGVTIHYMDEGIDTGDTISQKKVAIGPTDTARSLRDKLYLAAGDLLTELWDRLKRTERIPRIKQDESRSSYYQRRRPEDGLIDWNLPAEDIYNLIRALVKPWPGAFFYDQSGTKIVIDEFLTLDEVIKLKTHHHK